MEGEAEHSQQRRGGHEAKTEQGEVAGGRSKEWRSSDGDIVHFDPRVAAEQLARVQEDIRSLNTRCDKLVGTVEQLNTRCDKLEGTVQLLRENLAWEYAAPLVDLAHWESRGLEGEQAAEQDAHATIFFTMMIHYTRQLRKGKAPCPPRLMNVDENAILLGGGGRARLLCDEALLPHWRELMGALDFYHRLADDPVPVRICISDIQLSKEVMDILREGLGRCNLEKLCFWRNANNFVPLEDFRVSTSDVILTALDMVENSPELEEFQLEDNRTNDMAHVDSLWDIVRTHPSLRRLKLVRCCGEEIDGFSTLQSLLAAGEDNLREIDFSRNVVNTRGSTFLRDFLAGNPPLERLELNRCKLDDNDARLIATALSSNTNLRHLSLDKNEITKIGWELLMRAIFDYSSLNSAIDSNHTCQITRFAKNTFLYNGMDSGPDDAATNRRKKVLSMLAKRNKELSNVRHFESDGVTLKDIPLVLQGVHRACSRRRKICFSVVYEIMRGWEMPLLYERNRLPNTNSRENGENGDLQEQNAPSSVG